MLRFAVMFLHAIFMVVMIQVSTIAIASESLSSTDSYLITKVTDGDSLRAGKLRIRLHGIDAPEMKQICKAENGASYPCGVSARAHLIDMIQPPAEIRCQTITRDRYKRLVMRCFKAGIDLNAAMVRDGWAVAYRRYSKDYIAEENQAKASQKGLFAGSFQKPEQWRIDN
jgi:endonuclease YncB( thermonuclease family)